MSHAADYLIVQHVADLFRREPRNVGVVVRLDGETDGRFFGETEPGKIDGRQTRDLPAPGIYAQWVRYWRRTLSTKNGSAWDEILGTAKGNYQILSGGSVDRIGEDSIHDVTKFLYAALVSEGGIASALGAPGEEEAAIRLGESITAEFKRLGILLHGERTLTTPRHPVVQDAPVKGRVTDHVISFVQRAKHAVAMEPIDLGVKRDKKGMKYRAGWAGKVFEDILNHDPDATTVAIVSATSEEQRTTNAKHALALLSGANIVNWLSDSERKKFLDDRMTLAHAA